MTLKRNKPSGETGMSSQVRSPDYHASRLSTWNIINTEGCSMTPEANGQANIIRTEQ